MVSHWNREGDRILEAWFHQARATGVGRIPRRTSGRWSSSPGIVPGEWSSGIPGVRGTIPGNSQRSVVGHQFPRRRQRRSWKSGITPDTGVGVGLEAWCYTRAAGTEVIHVAATWFQGIPDCVARYKFPQNMTTTASIPTAARGVDTMGSVIYTRVAWVTAATEILVLKVHAGSLTFTLFILCHCFSLFINFATV